MTVFGISSVLAMETPQPYIKTSIWFSCRNSQVPTLSDNIYMSEVSLLILHYAVCLWWNTVSAWNIRHQWLREWIVTYLTPSIYRMMSLSILIVIHYRLTQLNKLQRNLNTNATTFFHENVSENIDGLVQERRNSIASALELRLSCTNPSISCSKQPCLVRPQEVNLLRLSEVHVYI